MSNRKELLDDKTWAVIAEKIKHQKNSPEAVVSPRPDDSVPVITSELHKVGQAAYSDALEQTLVKVAANPKKRDAIRLEIAEYAPIVFSAMARAPVQKAVDLAGFVKKEVFERKWAGSKRQVFESALDAYIAAICDATGMDHLARQYSSRQSAALAR